MIKTILDLFASPLFENPLVLFIASVVVMFAIVFSIDIVAKIYKAVASLGKRASKLNKRIEFIDWKERQRIRQWKEYLN